MKSAPKLKYYPLSLQQQRIYFENKLYPDKGGWNIYFQQSFDGKPDLIKLCKSMNCLLKKYLILKTEFILTNSSICQRILKHYKLRVKEIDVVDLKKSSKSFKNIFEEAIAKPFMLDKAPLFRNKIIISSENNFVLLFVIHHIISDGTSLDILKNELNSLYKNKYGQIKMKSILQYHDFAYSQHEYLKNNHSKTKKKYWENLISKIADIEPINLPFDFKRPLDQSFKGKKQGLVIDIDIVKKIKNFSINKRVSLFSVFLATFSVLFSKYSRQDKFIIGSPFAGRNNPDLSGIVGCFINSVIFYIEIDEKDKFIDLLKKIEKQVQMSYANQEYPYDLLMNPNLKRDKHLPFLYNVLINCQKLNNDESSLTTSRSHYKSEKIINILHDINIDIIYSNNLVDLNFINISIEYNIDLFKDTTIAKLIEHFETLLYDACTNPKKEISELELITKNEKEMLFKYSDSSAKMSGISAFKNVITLLEEQMVESPENKAIKFLNETINYQKLDEEANKVKSVLLKRNIQANSIVAVLLKNCPELIISMIGILKAGCAFVLIDVEYPIARIKYILDNCEANYLITSNEYRDKIDLLEIPKKGILFMEQIRLEKTIDSRKINISANDIAYIVYTSGTMGKPKGIMIKHENLTNYVNAFLYEFCPTSRDVIVQQSSPTFDTIIEEVFPILLKGGTIVVLPKKNHVNIESLKNIIFEESVTILSCTPLLLNELNRNNLEHYPRLIISGGDKLKINHIDKLIKKSMVYNTYGPSETTVCASYYKLEGKINYINIPIGKPILNYKLYVLDKNNNMMPIHIAGELCIGGMGVGKGYLNNPDLTNMKFIENPFIKGDTIYKTGDLAKWLPDGNLMFLGRVDNQVKLRGYRIELEEIEKNILNFDQVDEAIVVLIDDERLIAFYTSKEDISTMRLREYLFRFLPEYMIPSSFIHIEKIPLTQNGKTDKKQLIRIAKYSYPYQSIYRAPKTDIEYIIASVWKKVLDLDKIGRDDNFFMLGGTSLQAVSVIAELDDKLKIEPYFRDFFNQTLEQFAKNLEERNKRK